MKKTILSLMMMALLSSCETEEEKQSKIFIAECEYNIMIAKCITDNLHLIETFYSISKVQSYGSPAYDSTLAYIEQLKRDNDSLELKIVYHFQN